MLIEMQNVRREMATRLEGAREEINKQLPEQLNKSRAKHEEIVNTREGSLTDEI